MSKLSSIINASYIPIDLAEPRPSGGYYGNTTTSWIDERTLYFQDHIIDAANDTTATFLLMYPSNLRSLDEVFSNITVHGRANGTNILSPPPLSMHINNRILAYVFTGDTMFNSTWLESNAVCQPGNAYRWGFSASVMLTFFTITALYTIIVAFLSRWVYTYSQADRYTREFNVYRDALDLAGELRAQLGEDVVGMPAKDLGTKADEAPGTIVLETQDMARSRYRQRLVDENLEEQERPRKRFWAQEWKEREQETQDILRRIEAENRAAAKARKRSRRSTPLGFWGRLGIWFGRPSRADKG